MLAGRQLATRAGKPPGPALLDWRRPMPRHHHHVYVVQLSDRVWNEARFRRANPDYRLGKPFVYVGMTGLDPDRRFDKHKAGIQANRFVFEYGLRLLPALYEVYNPRCRIALRRRWKSSWQSPCARPATVSGRGDLQAARNGAATARS
jgi:hypothetical protein